MREKNKKRTSIGVKIEVQLIATKVYWAGRAYKMKSDQNDKLCGSNIYFFKLSLFQNCQKFTSYAKKGTF